MHCHLEIYVTSLRLENSKIKKETEEKMLSLRNNRSLTFSSMKLFPAFMLTFQGTLC